MIITHWLMTGALLRALSNPMDTAPTLQTPPASAISAEIRKENHLNYVTMDLLTPLDVHSTVYPSLPLGFVRTEQSQVQTHAALSMEMVF